MPGYNMAGNDTDFCDSDGKWSQQLPDCIASFGEISLQVKLKVK
jgi:hypothetical protein